MSMLVHQTRTSSSTSVIVLMVATIVFLTFIAVTLRTQLFPHSNSMKPIKGYMYQKQQQILQEPPFSLIVQLVFTDIIYQKQFLLDITPLCNYIQQYEYNTTLSYQIIIAESNPLHIMIIERYTNKLYGYQQIHKSSTEFIIFRQKLQIMQNENHVTINGTSFYDTNIGFIHH